MLGVLLRMPSISSIDVQKRRLLEGLDGCESSARYMDVSRMRQSGVAVWRTEIVMGAGGKAAVGQVCFPT